MNKVHMCFWFYKNAESANFLLDVESDRPKICWQDKKVLGQQNKIPIFVFDLSITQQVWSWVYLSRSCLEYISEYLKCWMLCWIQHVSVLSAYLIEVTDLYYELLWLTKSARRQRLFRAWRSLWSTYRALPTAISSRWTFSVWTWTATRPAPSNCAALTCAVRSTLTSARPSC